MVIVGNQRRKRKAVSTSKPSKLKTSFVRMLPIIVPLEPIAISRLGMSCTAGGNVKICRPVATIVLKPLSASRVMADLVSSVIVLLVRIVPSRSKAANLIFSFVNSLFKTNPFDACYYFGPRLLTMPLYLLISARLRSCPLGTLPEVSNSSS